MVFDVLDPKAENIEDPETGEVLGSVYHPKVQVKAFLVEPRLSLARTFKSRRVNVGGTGALTGLAGAFQPAKWVVQHETLKTRESTWEDIDESQSYVKTGDPVVEAREQPEGEESGVRTLTEGEHAQLAEGSESTLRDTAATVEPASESQPGTKDEET